MPETLKKIAGTNVAFGDVVQLSKERSKDPEADGFERYLGLEHLEPSDLTVRSWGDIADGTTFTNVFRPGQVLFGKRRAYQRKVAVAHFSGVCSGDIYVLEPKGDHLLPELLPFICQSGPFYDYVISMSQGGLSPRVNWKALAECELALPPLVEQRRIAEALQAAHASGEGHRALVESVAQARLAMIFDYEGQLSSGNMTSLSRVTNGLQSGKSPASSGEAAEPPEHGVLKVSAVGDWDFVENENKVVAEQDFRSDLEVEAGDFLVTRANADPASVGRTCIVASTRRKLMLSDKTWRLCFHDDYPYDSLAVLAWTKSRGFREHIRNHLNGTDAKNISQANFLAGPIPKLDSTFDTFSRCVTQLSESLKSLQARAQQLRDLQRVLLAEALER